jgi:hypothetical protein
MPDYLNPGTRKLIQTKMERGGYATPDDLVVAALASLEQQERFGEFGPGEMDKLLAAGESGGAFLDGAAALAARRQRRAERHNDVIPPLDRPAPCYEVRLHGWAYPASVENHGGNQRNRAAKEDRQGAAVDAAGRT